MKMILVVITIMCFLPFYATAHETHSHVSQPQLLKTEILIPKVSISIDGVYRMIRSNGVPNHKTGDFPGRGNPHAISAQDYTFKMRTDPNIVGNIHTVTNRHLFGVAVNGVPFDPGTAEYWKNDRNSGWVKEGIVKGTRLLGIDENNGHVQPNGAYHYHGIPTALVKDDLSHIGYAADGHKIYVSRDDIYKPGYRLKRGNRPKNSPGGSYDGTYTQDFQFVVGYGDLDQCNGMKLNGEYVYFLTGSFPFVSRCWKGLPDESFIKEPPDNANNGPGLGRDGPRRGPGGRPPPPRRF